MGEIIMGLGPTSLVLIKISIVHIHESLVDEEVVHTRGSPVNVGTDHVHGSTQTGDQIPRKNDGPIMRPWML